MRQDPGEDLLGRLSVVEPLNPRIEHPIHETIRLFKIEAESFAYRLTESNIGQAFVAGATLRAQNGAAKQGYENEVVEVTRLERSVLAVVREAQEFSGPLFEGPVVFHPCQDGRYDQRCRRAAAFSRQTGKLVDVTRLLGRLVTAMRTKA